jgi:hypothetical protein
MFNFKMRDDVMKKIINIQPSYVYVATLLDPRQKDPAFLIGRLKWDEKLLDAKNGTSTPQSYRSATVDYTSSITKMKYAESEMRKLVAQVPATELAESPIGVNADAPCPPPLKKTKTSFSLDLPTV